MADDEMNTDGLGQEGSEDDVSWEDAFQEAALGRGKAPNSTMEEDLLASDRGMGNLLDRSKKNGANSSAVDLDFLLDISLNVTAEIGRTKMLINELLQLNQGSIIPLDKQVGESVDVLVNGKLMARGEVVMVNEMFAIRLTEIIGPKERLQQLT